MNAPTCYCCGEQLTQDERYDVVPLGRKTVVVCRERDRAHEIVRAS